MPKLTPVTPDEIKAADDRCSDLCMELHDINNRLEKSFQADVGNTLERARSFLALSQAVGRTAQLLMIRAAMAEDRRELETQLRAKL